MRPFGIGKRVACTRWAAYATLIAIVALGCSDITPRVPDDVPTATAEITLSIGETSGAPEYEFGRVAGLAADTLGRIYVADGQADEIRMYGPDGSFLLRVAGGGSGPGEVRSPCCLAFGPDGRLWVRDGGNRRYNWYEIGDRVLASGTRLMAHGDVFYPGEPTFTPRGELIDVGHQIDVNMESVVKRFHMDTTGTVVRTEAIPNPPADSIAEHQVAGRRDGAQTILFFQQPFGPSHLIAHSPSGGWATAVSSRYAVRWLGADSIFEWRIQRDWPGPIVDAAERDSARAVLAQRVEWGGLHLSDLPFGIPDRKTPLQALGFDELGQLWVYLSPAAGEDPSAHVYNRQGELLERRRWPRQVSLRSGYLADTFALGVTRDSLGVQRVVRLRWAR